MDTLTAALRLRVGRPLADLGEQFVQHPLVVSVEQERLAVSVLAADAARNRALVFALKPV